MSSLKSSPFLEYLDKEMNIMGILSVFSVAVAGSLSIGVQARRLRVRSRLFGTKAVRWSRPEHSQRCWLHSCFIGSGRCSPGTLDRLR